MDDIRAVMDAVRSERAALLGFSEGAALPALYAASHPERTTALILYDGVVSQGLLITVAATIGVLYFVTGENLRANAGQNYSVFVQIILGAAILFFGVRKYCEE